VSKYIQTSCIVTMFLWMASVPVFRVTHPAWQAEKNVVPFMQTGAYLRSGGQEQARLQSSIRLNGLGKFTI